MKARKNPTNEQLLRRLRRGQPENPNDLRVKNDPYWALRFQHYPHSYAIRAFRNQPPIYSERTIPNDVHLDDDYEPDELFFLPGSTVTDIEVAIRPELSEEAIRELSPLPDKEYTVWDQEIRGFGARVRTSGYKCYVVHYRIGNPRKLRKNTLGPTNEYSLEEARAWAKSLKRKARRDGKAESE